MAGVNFIIDNQSLKKIIWNIFLISQKKLLHLQHDFKQSKYSLVVAMLKNVGFV
jgi:hypothetical protein